MFGQIAKKAALLLYPMFATLRSPLHCIFEYPNHVRSSIVVDGNVVTAMAPAFREFGIEIAEWLAIPCRDAAFAEIQYLIEREIGFSTFRRIDNAEPMRDRQPLLICACIAPEMKI